MYFITIAASATLQNITRVIRRVIAVRKGIFR